MELDRVVNDLTADAHFGVKMVGGRTKGWFDREVRDTCTKSNLWLSGSCLGSDP